MIAKLALVCGAWGFLSDALPMAVKKKFPMKPVPSLAPQENPANLKKAPIQPVVPSQKTAMNVQKAPAAQAPAPTTTPAASAPVSGSAAATMTTAPPAVAAPAPAPALAPASGGTNITLTAEQSAQLKACTACGARINASFTNVRAALTATNSSAYSALTAVRSALDIASATIAQLQGSLSSLLTLAGVDDSFLGDFVTSLGGLVNDTLTRFSDTADSFDSDMQSVLSQYLTQRDEANETMAAAIAAMREALLVANEKAAEAEETATEASANTTLVQAALRARQVAVVVGPVSAAQQAVAKANSTVDKAIDVMVSLNDTLLADWQDDMITKLNDTMIKLQDGLTSAMGKFPEDVPPAVTDQVDALFDQVFAAINTAVGDYDALGAAINMKVLNATNQAIAVKTCLAPLGAMVEDLDGALPRSYSWSLLLAMAVVALSRALMP